MKRQPWGLYAVALAIGVVGLVALGVDLSTLLVVVLVLACPLMMLFIRGGHSGHADHGAATEDRDHSGTAPDSRDPRTNPR